MKKIISLVVACVILIGLCTPASVAMATDECTCDQCSQAAHMHEENETVVPLRAEFCENCNKGMLRPHLRYSVVSTEVCPHSGPLWFTHEFRQFYNAYICDYCGYHAYDVNLYTRTYCTYLGQYI